MAVFRVEKTKDYTVMANHHLRNIALSLKAKGLLSLMLSLPENWDYTTKGLSCICKDGIDSINATIKELEEHGYVVRRRTRNEKGQLTSIEYTILEQPQLLDNSELSPKREYPILDKPTLDNPTLGKPILEKPKLGEPILVKPHQLNTNTSKTNSLNPDVLNIDSSNPYQSNPNPIKNFPQKRSGYEEIGCDTAQEVKEMVLENLEYECISQRYNDDRLDEIVDLMVETLCSTKPTINIAGEEYPAQLVKEKLLRINSSHIEYVFFCLDKNTTYIRNIRRYLLATLFNAPSTIDHYYTALVKHDFGGRP